MKMSARRSPNLPGRRGPGALQAGAAGAGFDIAKRLHQSGADGGGAARLVELAAAGDNVERVDGALTVVVDMGRLDGELGLGEDARPRRPEAPAGPARSLRDRGGGPGLLVHRD